MLLSRDADNLTIIGGAVHCDDNTMEWTPVNPPSTGIFYLLKPCDPTGKALGTSEVHWGRITSKTHYILMKRYKETG